MTHYSYAQLEGLWINAGGSRADAAIAAAIAEAESGGNSQAQNASGATGLWQILGNPFPGNAFDPQTNAKMAVSKWKSAGGFSPWVTYTDGAYKQFLSPGTSPDPNPPPGSAGGKGGTPTTQLTGAEQTTVDCLWSLKWAGFGSGNPIIQGAGIASGLVPGFGFVGAATSGGDICIISRSEVRAMIGTGLYLGGALVGLAGLAVLVAAAGMTVLPPLGAAASGVGGVLSLVPGAQGAGAALSAVGSRAQSVKPRRAKLLQKDRQSRGAREDTAREKQLGQPKENPDLEVRGGAVKETTQQRAARVRRQAGAARARAKRAAGQGRPAPREEAGF